MTQVTLTRGNSTDAGTFGILVVPSGKKYATLELPWKDNAAMVSCVPTGTYQCSLRFSNRFGKYYYGLKDVPKRTDILIHPANWAGDTDKGYYSELNGCIAIGMTVADMKTPAGNIQRAITSSKLAISEFMNEMKSEPFELVISVSPEV